MDNNPLSLSLYGNSKRSSAARRRSAAGAAGGLGGGWRSRACMSEEPRLLSVADLLWQLHQTRRFGRFFNVVIKWRTTEELRIVRSRTTWREDRGMIVNCCGKWLVLRAGNPTDTWRCRVRGETPDDDQAGVMCVGRSPSRRFVQLAVYADRSWRNRSAVNDSNEKVCQAGVFLQWTGFGISDSKVSSSTTWFFFIPRASTPKLVL